MTVRRTKHNARMSGAVRWAYALLFCILCVTSDTGIFAPRFMRHYYASPYFSNDFFDEMQVMFADGYLDEDGVIALDDFASAHYHVSAGLRRTTDQPGTYEHTVWMVGNSTLWGERVADGWTIPSYLQRMLNSHRLRLRAVNAGQKGIGIRFEVRNLKRLPVQPGDIVIFFDGAWDYYNNVRWKNDEPKKRSIAVYQDFVQQAKAWTTSQGATFYHFLQPGTGIDYSEYALMAGNDPILYAPDIFFFDDIHLDDGGHNLIAGQIYARLFGAF